MSAQHPTPWRAEGRDNGKRGRLRREYWSILDRNDFFVAEGLDETTAREIADAVNERERLRDIVRKTLRAIDALYTVAAPGAIVKELTPDRTCLDVPIGKIVAEARAAIGEGETPTGKGEM